MRSGGGCQQIRGICRRAKPSLRARGRATYSHVKLAAHAGSACACLNMAGIDGSPCTFMCNIYNH